MPGFSNDDTQEVSSPYSYSNQLSQAQTTANPGRGGQTTSNPSRGGQTTPGTSSSFSSPSSSNSGGYSGNTVSSNSGGSSGSNSGGYDAGSLSGSGGVDSMVGSGGGTSARPAQTKSEVRDAQTHLSALGLYDGRVDGLNGPKTRDATLAFQQQWNKDHPQDLIKEDGILGWEPTGPIGSLEPGTAETRPRLELAGQMALANRSGYTQPQAGAYVPPAPVPASPVAQLGAAAVPTPVPRPASPLESLRASPDGGAAGMQGTVDHSAAIKAIIAPYVGGSFGNRPAGTYGNGAGAPAAPPPAAAPPAAAAPPSDATSRLAAAKAAVAAAAADAGAAGQAADTNAASLAAAQRGPGGFGGEPNLPAGYRPPPPAAIPVQELGPDFGEADSAPVSPAQPDATALSRAKTYSDTSNSYAPEFGNEKVTNVPVKVQQAPTPAAGGGIGGVFDNVAAGVQQLGAGAAGAGAAVRDAALGFSDRSQAAINNLFSSAKPTPTPAAAAPSPLEAAKPGSPIMPAVPAPVDRVMNVLGLSGRTDTHVATPPSPELPSQKGYTGVPPATDSLGARGYKSQPPAAEATPPADFYRGVITGPAEAPGAPGVQGSAAPMTQQIIDKIAQAPPDRRQDAADHAIILGAAAHQMVGAPPEQKAKIIDGLVASGVIDQAKADDLRQNPPSDADLQQVADAGMAVHDLYGGGESALSGAKGVQVASADNPYGWYKDSHGLPLQTQPTKLPVNGQLMTKEQYLKAYPTNGPEDWQQMMDDQKARVNQRGQVPMSSRERRRAYG